MSFTFSYLNPFCRKSFNNCFSWSLRDIRNTFTSSTMSIFFVSSRAAFSSRSIRYLLTAIIKFKNLEGVLLRFKWSMYLLLRDNIPFLIKVCIARHNSFGKTNHLVDPLRQKVSFVLIQRPSFDHHFLIPQMQALAVLAMTRCLLHVSSTLAYVEWG